MFKFDLKKRLVAYCAVAVVILAMIFWFASTAVVDAIAADGFNFLQITFGAKLTVGSHAGQYLSFSVGNFFVFLLLLLGLITAVFGVLWSSKYNQFVRLLAALILITVGILAFFSVAFVDSSVFISNDHLSLGWGVYAVGILSIIAGLTLVIDRFVLRNKL